MANLALHRVYQTCIRKVEVIKVMAEMAVKSRVVIENPASVRASVRQIEHNDDVVPLMVN